MQTVNVNGGSIGLSSLISGEDQAMNWIYTADGANVYQNFKALSLNDPTTYPVTYALNGMGIGLSGQAGDFLRKIVAVVPSSATNARIQLFDLSAASFSNVDTGTLTQWTSDTTVNFNAGASMLDVSAPPLVGQHLICQAVFTGGVKTAMIARKITAVSSVTSPAAAGSLVTLTVESMTTSSLASISITTGAANRCFIAPLWEVLPGNAAAGVHHIELGVKSKVGGWRVFIDSGVTPTFIGRFV